MGIYLAIILAERHALRGYDCVQLASALIVQRARVATRLTSLELVSGDSDLNMAAQAEGLTVNDPNDYS